MADNPLTEELFIVLTLPRKDLTPALRLQESIAEKYNLYSDDNYPELHITLNRINKENLPLAQKIISNIINTVDKVQITIDNLKCFKMDNNYIVLNVNETKSLTDLADALNARLNQVGISTINDYNNWKFHITLVNNFFATNPMPKSELKKLCFALDGIPKPISTTAKAVEIWRPTLDPIKKTVVSFKL
ncbi:hypothetical protein JCM16358_04260 [Halanaerocella petrolearia]